MRRQRKAILTLVYTAVFGVFALSGALQAEEPGAWGASIQEAVVPTTLAG